jgi:hypothetical protein
VGATLSSLIGDKQKRVQPTSFVDFTQFADAVVAMLHNSKGLTRLAEDDKLRSFFISARPENASLLVYYTATVFSRPIRTRPTLLLSCFCRVTTKTAAPLSRRFRYE